MKKSKFLTFVLSAVPGLGHYYLGLMNRGLQVMILFFGSFYLYSIFGFNQSFPYVSLIIWFYSLFDALQQHKIISEEEEFIDSPLIPWNKLNLKRTWIGWFLIFLGIYFAVDKLIYSFLWEYYHTFRNLLLSLILIGIGFYLVSKKNFNSVKEDRSGIE